MFDQKEYNRNYYQKHKEKLRKKMIEYEKEYRRKNKEKIKQRKKEYNKRPENVKRQREYQREYRKDPIFRLNKNMGRGINSALKENKISKNRRRWEKLVNYTREELKWYIERLFKPGMSWDNYGKWHLDHIVPISFFKYASTDDVEFKYCWSLHNLQPLWKKDNLRKSDRLLISEK